ncbi:MAG: magnesium transporter MgtE N-terminal domain-containing protein [Thermomicrobiales bacterium]
MLYLSQLINAPIRDRDGERIATVRDLIARIGEGYPPVTGLIARQGRREFFIPTSGIASIDADGVTLSSAKLNIGRFERRDGEILLSRDVLDRQIIDVNGKRVVRVNDVQIAPVESSYRLIGADVGARALLARLGFGKKRDRAPLGDLVDWADIEYLAANAPTVRLKVSHDRLAKLHPAEIANIIEDLSYHEGSEIVSALDDETAADTLEELDDERQADILEQMDSARAADILEEMAPDDAADVLADMPQEKQDELLALMEPEESEDVRELLEYNEDTAGGMMTTDYAAVPSGLTAGGALAALAGMPEQPDFVYYLYVVEHDAATPSDAPHRTDDDIPEYLRGVVTLRQLVLALPTMPVTELMEREIVTVAPTDRADDAARQLVEYGLYALPVVTEGGAMLGIITADDAFDRLLPDSWRKRLRVFS